MTNSTPKSRLPRTGTLVLIAVVLLIGGGALMVWLPYHQEQRAIAEIERHGGQFLSAVIRPAWIPSAVDVEYLEVFERVTEIYLYDTTVSNLGLEHLRGMTNLLGLALDNTQVGDGGLEHLRGLTNLEFLSLNDTQISNAGLEHLRGLTNLKFLILDNTQISGAGLSHLRGLANLRELSLHNTQVTRAGIEELQKALPDCEIYWTPPAE